ncbi:MAG: hypothetical protein QOJ29_2989 [Thermoleophilaceae bacterium]|nr:hypothetical protein [Thermoleophilaceae bacterium]
MVLLLVASAIAFLVTRGGSSNKSSLEAAVATAKKKAKPKPPPVLPRGGRHLFPRHRIVAFYGAPQNVELGALGIGTPDQAGRKLLAQMRPYRRGGRTLLPAMELIAVVAAGSAQQDGSYSYKQSFRTVKTFLAAARKIKALLILDIQPGHADFLKLTKHFGRFLREPDVALALDPEWHTPNAVPGTVIGSTDAATVNRVSAYLQGVVQKYNLPDKMLLVHQFTESMIQNKQLLKHRRGVPLVLNVDGFGGQEVKIAKYNDFTHPSTRSRSGFKLFYKEDTNTMTPQQVLRLRPRPDVVIYE